MADTQYDVLIIGGGMVGASLACALAELPLRIALVEAVPAGADDQPSYDARSTALAEGTRRIFEALQLWPGMAGAVAPIRLIHVSERGRFGVTRMRAEEHGVEALGYVVENRVLGQALAARMARLPQLRLLCPARFIGLETRGPLAEVEIEDAAGRRRLQTRLVIGADGAESRVRAALGIGSERREYGQTAIVANVTPARDPAGTAYERFTPDGPLALLPMTEQRCALVWTQPSDRVAATLALPDAEFLSALNDAFGQRLGRFLRAGRRQAYPLVRVLSLQNHAPRALLLGNAAHSLHPVAGQGFNLGLRDVAILAETLAGACREGLDPGTEAVLARYAEARSADQAHVSGFTDGLVRLFSNRIPGLAGLRHLGLLGLDLLPPVRARFARRSMGLTGHTPRLARGLPLAD